MSRKTYVACPYCGMDVPVLVSDEYFQKTVETCDTEEGGCGRDFVAAVNVNITARAIRIEGET